MKKLSVLLGVIFLSTGISNAVMYDNGTSNIDLLRSQGFSEATLQVVDTAKNHDGNGTPRYYKRSMNNGKKIGKAYSYLKVYFDPAQDDGLFGEHQINFSNSWDFAKNNYSERYKKAKEVDNL